MDIRERIGAPWPPVVWAGLAVVPVAIALAGWPFAGCGAAAALAGFFAGKATVRVVPPASVEVPAPALPDPDSMAKLRHDLNGILAPALLSADRLQMHADPAVKRAGEILSETVERAAARVAKAKQ